MTEAPASQAGPSLTLWENADHRPIVARVAIGGDFLPAGRLLPLGKSSWSDLAAPALPHFSDVDITFANLECPIDVRGLDSRPLIGIGQIVSAEHEVLDYLSAIRGQVVGIANNHACDFGTLGMDRTREALCRGGFAPLGSTRSLENTPEVFVWYGPGNLRIGFWACAKAARELATRRSPGVEPATIDRALQALDIMKQKGVNFAVALVHAGCLRTNRPAPEDAILLREFAEIGYEIVAASHSHRISGAEKIFRHGKRPSFLFHGLGSLVSGYIAAPLEREGLIVVAGFDADGTLADVTVRPVYLPDYGIGEVPSPEMSDNILRRFESLSVEIADGSYAARFYKDLSSGLVRLYLRDVNAAFRQSGLKGLAQKAARLRLSHLKRLMHTIFAT